VHKVRRESVWTPVKERAPASVQPERARVGLAVVRDRISFLDLRDPRVDHPVVVASGDAELRALGPGDDAHDGARRIDRGRTLDEALRDARLLGLQNAQVALRGMAVDSTRILEVPFDLLRLHCTAGRQTGGRARGVCDMRPATCLDQERRRTGGPLDESPSPSRRSSPARSDGHERV
jgi:hypothetical protein